MNLSFGKFKGMPLEQIPDDYLGWLSGLELRDDRLRCAVEEELERRIFLQENRSRVNMKLVDEIVGAGLRSLAKKSSGSWRFARTNAAGERCCGLA